MTDTQKSSTMSPELARIAELAKEDKQRKFFSIAHLLTIDALYAAFLSLRTEASAGVDGVTYKQYDGNTWEKIPILHGKLKSGEYRAQPLRRIYIPKEDGRQRPISIPSLEDKIVQRATVKLLNAIYEQDFLECSYGFRPERSAQDALDEIGKVICRRPISFVLEADICSYFDNIVRSQLMEMIEKRVSDGSILRLIRKWINVGVIDDGRLLMAEKGTGQGQVISPLLANIYLHYVLDEWFQDVVKPRLKGEAYEVRFADDFILCFQYREDAEKVLEVLHQRFAKYGLQLHPDKTRLIEFGPKALTTSEQQGGTKPATFDFLGFTHICARSRRGYFTIHVRTMRKRFDQLPQFVAVLSEGSSYLEDLVEPADSGQDFELGPLRAASSSPSIAASSHHACLGFLAGVGESGLRNRVQQFCKLGSVRGEVRLVMAILSWARSRKRRIQTR